MYERIQEKLIESFQLSICHFPAKAKYFVYLFFLAIVFYRKDNKSI